MAAWLSRGEIFGMEASRELTYIDASGGIKDRVLSSEMVNVESGDRFRSGGARHGLAGRLTPWLSGKGCTEPRKVSESENSFSRTSVSIICPSLAVWLYGSVAVSLTTDDNRLFPHPSSYKTPEDCSFTLRIARIAVLG